MKIRLKITIAAALALVINALTGCYSAPRYISRRPVRGAPGEFYCPGQEGIASYYGDAFQGRPTASGETFDKNLLTAAHRTLPLGTRARVTNLENGKSVEVRVNDRGPFAKARVIDLSEAAARKIGMIENGTARVRIEILD